MHAALAIVALLPALISAQFTGVQINPNGDTTQCLTVVGTPSNGALIETTSCVAGNANQLWNISPGNNPTTFTLSGTNYCVDAGEDPANLVRAKIWTCYPGLTQQTWYYTDDLRIAITGGNQCLDSGGSSGQTETYQCTTGDTNQIWTTNSGGSSTTTTTTTSTSSSCGAIQTQCPTTPDPCCLYICAEAQVPFDVCSPVDNSGEFAVCELCSVFTASTTSTTSTSTSSGTGPTPTGQQIHFNGGINCLTVMEGYAAEGTPVELAECFEPNDTYYGLQSWVINRGSGAVQLAGTNYCLDAGSNPANGGGVKIWECYAGLHQQTWYYTGDNRIAITGGNQCLDVQAGSLPVGSEGDGPYGSQANVQTWECTSGDVQQIWTL